MSEAELAWAAGFICADGSIGVYKVIDRRRNASWMDPQIEAYNTDLSYLEKLQRILGGRIYLKAKAGSNYGSHLRKKDYYRWQVHRKEALRVAQLIAPFMEGEKKEKNEAIIKYYEERASK